MNDKITKSYKTLIDSKNDQLLVDLYQSYTRIESSIEEIVGLVSHLKEGDPNSFAINFNQILNAVCEMDIYLRHATTKPEDVFNL